MATNPLELFANIRDARQHISRLKNEAHALEADPFNSANHNMREYMKNVSYSLSKNNQTIEKKCNDYKAKLPSIHKQDKSDLDISLINGYKKNRKHFQHPSRKRISEESTKIDNSFSLSIQNRPAKIHSNIERTYKPEVAVADNSHSQIQIPSQFLRLKEEAARLEQITITKKERASSHIIQDASYHRKRVKYFDVNKSFNIQDPLKPPTDLEYNSIVDKFSKHEFMIINGRIASDSPEFASYTRIYESIFPRIRTEIGRLEQILQQKNVHFARFDGKRLAYICLKDEVTKDELIDCLIDENNDLRGLLLPGTKYTGEGGRQKAAKKIQSYYKMYLTREKYRLLRDKTLVIQRFFRKNLNKLQLQRKIHERNSKMLQNFESRQEKLMARWREIKTGKRIEIHLNSMEMEEEKRLSVQNFSERENIQLSRIFRLKDENVILIYISTTELSPELINYYYRMLDLAAVPKYQDRLLFFSPSDAHKFPQHFSASKLLYYSSKTLRQLRIITEDLPTLLHPGYPCNELIKICEILNCYLFSGNPQQTKPFTTQSQTIRFMKNLSLNMLPSTMEMYDYGEFLNTFSVMIIKNPEVGTWVLKIDDEFGGRGIAYVDFSRTKFIQAMLDKVDYGEQEEMFATNAEQAINEPHNQEITIKIRDYLREHLVEKLKIATPTVYRTYEDFMGRFIKKGGVIEARPTLSNRETLSYPSVTFCLEPSGEQSIVATYEKILGSPYRSYACSFPQKCMDMKIASNIIRQICESFKLRKIFGYFTIDFVCLDGANEKGVWPIGIDPFINNYTSSFFLFDLLMRGTFFPDKNIYLVEREDEKSESFSVDTVASEAQQQFESLAERTYTFLPHFFNPNLHKLKIKQFFKQARIERFNFDVGNKEGLCILLLDQLTSGTMSMMAVSALPYNAISLMKRVVEFIVRLSSVKNVEYGRTESLPSSDRIPIKDVLSLFISLVRKDERSDAKAKAIRKYENQKDLEFIS